MISNGYPTDRPEGNQVVSDPLAKSLVKINTELSRVIKTLGSSSTRSTPVPDQQTPGWYSSNIAQTLLSIGRLDQVQ